MIESLSVREIRLSVENLVAGLLKISERETVCLLDSCNVSNLGSHLLIAGIKPVEILEITNESAEKTLKIFNRKLAETNLFTFFTISYDFGLKLEKIAPRKKEFSAFPEPDISLFQFDCLIIHDYKTGKTQLSGNENRFDELESFLLENAQNIPNYDENFSEQSIVASNFTRQNYLLAIEEIKEFIRRGDTYQTNLTQQLRANLPETLSPQKIFWRLRRQHPAPFAAFLRRENDFVISASPERFFKVESGEWRVESKNHTNSALSTQTSALISTSPIKGTRPRGKTAAEDIELKNELLNSAKDRAENVMIVDLLRNDIGRICRFGSVKVENLCDLEEHPTLFHLVSTVTGKLRENISIGDIIKAVFPCGSITGAPKIRTMQIIDEIETAPRGLSMGAIGYSIQDEKLKIKNSQTKTPHSALRTPHYLDLSVAIRTMVVRNKEAIFNVGGGIVIDSNPESEYEETLTKARALLNAINGKFIE